MHATAQGHAAIATTGQRGEANAKDRDEQTALLLAVQGGHIPVQSYSPVGLIRR
jgi:hypothetical protein